MHALSQPIFEADYVEPRSRMSTFLRLILAIPHFFMIFFGGVAAAVATIVAWFSIVLTGQYPPALYAFVGAFQQYGTAVYGYLTLLTDEYPPFSFDTSGYPVRIAIPERKAEYNRLKTALRLIFGIPVFIILYAMQIVYEVGAFLAWFVILALGKQPKGLQDLIVLGLSYQQRAYCYLYLMTEDWPPFVDPKGGSVEGPQGGSPLPPAPQSVAPPTSPENLAATSGLSGGDPLAR